MSSSSLKKRSSAKTIIADIFLAILAGFIVGSAYHIFQNSNSFAPGGVGGLATITHHLIGGGVDWSILMLSFNIPIFILLIIFVNKKLGLLLTLYMVVQSFTPKLYEAVNLTPYCEGSYGEDFNVIFACIATGVISGFGFSIMLKRFGASGGTYGISALIKRARPQTNIAYVSFILDASVVIIAFFVYGMNINPAICTLINLFIANLIVDHGLSGIKNQYKFEIITSDPEGLAEELMIKLKHGVTRIAAHGMYSDTDRYLLVCIINKRQVGEMMRILKARPETFASFEKVNEVFGNYKSKVK